MAEQRTAFRFRLRLPWLQNAPTPTPQPAAQRRNPTQPTVTTTPAPTTETQTPPRPAIPATAQRPPFRPPGVAPAQAPPPQSQASPIIESQTSSPSRAPTRSKASLQPTSHSRTSQARAASQTPSPSRTAPQSRAASQPSSPSHMNSQPQPSSQPASQPEPSSHLASQPEGRTSAPPSPAIPTEVQTRAVSMPISPSKRLQPITQVSSQPPLTSTKPQPTVLEKEETKLAGTQPQKLEAEEKTQIISGTTFNSQTPMQIETSAQPYVTIAQPSKAPASVTSIEPSSDTVLETPTPTHTPDSSTTEVDTKSLGLTKSEEKPEEMSEVKEVMKKTNGAYKEPQKNATEFLTQGLGLQAQTKQPSTVQGVDGELEKKNAPGTKEVRATSASNRRKTKALISHSKDKNVVGASRQNSATLDRERAPLHKEIKDDFSKLILKMRGTSMDEKPFSVITLTGENRGASMQLGWKSVNRDETIHIHRAYKVNPDESSETTIDGDGRSTGESSRDSKVKEHWKDRAFLNNNIQSINNSILFNSSITEKNSGIQLVSPRNPEPSKSTNKKESIDARKAEFNVNRSQKLTYEPSVRRRCLRGLFMEPSDSDLDNPEKPHRHGCRYCSKEKNKETK